MPILKTKQNNTKQSINKIIGDIMKGEELNKRLLLELYFEKLQQTETLRKGETEAAETVK